MKKFILIPIIIPFLFLSCIPAKNKQIKDLSKTDFIYIEGNMFKLKTKEFFPIMLNYVVSFRHIDKAYILSPVKEYENPDIFESNTKDSIEIQIRGHLQLIKEMGFNTIRLVFDRVIEDSLKYYYPADEKKLYLKKDYDLILNGLDEFIKLAKDYDIKIMLLIKAPVENKDLEAFTTHLLMRFQENPCIFAYDFFNEPLYFDRNPKRKKEEAYKIVRGWKNMMLENAPNQLLTIGFSEPIEVFEWDPALLPVDFIAFHTYHPLRVSNEIYWYSKFTNKPWMIGETALPADGDSVSYDDQRQFMKEVYRKVVDCGGCGLGWWEFQEVPNGNFEAKYTGILNHKGITITKDGKYSILGTVKPVVNAIKEFKNYKSKSSCNYEVNYYNIWGYNNIVLMGKIVNSETNKPIEGAVIRGWNEYWTVGMNTYTNKDGVFTLYSNDECVHFEISAPKMSKIKFDFKTNYTLITKKYYDIKSLPYQTLESQSISYKPFLTYPVIDSGNNEHFIFNFNSLKFNKTKFAGSMGIKKLEPLTFSN